MKPRRQKVRGGHGDVANLWLALSRLRLQRSLHMLTKILSNLTPAGLADEEIFAAIKAHVEAAAPPAAEGEAPAGETAEPAAEPPVEAPSDPPADPPAE
jgi:hypothetical protein